MGKNWILPIAILGGAIALSVRRKVMAAGDLRYVPHGARLQKKESGLLSLRLLARLGIVNPTPTSLQFDRLEGELLYDSARIAEVRIIQPVSLPADEETILELPIIISTLAIASRIATAIAKGEWSKEITLSGTIYVGPVKIPIIEKWSLEELIKS